MGNERRIVATFRCGNAIGIIEEPVLPHGVPKKRRGDLWKVKIGPIDQELARSRPFPAEEFDSVVRQLRAFLERTGMR